MRRFWKPEEIEWLKANYPDLPTFKICEALGRNRYSVNGMAFILKLKKSETFNSTPLSGRIMPGARQGLSTRFKKGNVSYNKGKKQREYMSVESIAKTKATRFKKGNKPHNTKQDGVISVRKSKGRPYQWVRVAEGMWRELHRIMWEEHNGKIPKGYNVQFRDGNSLNCVIENLYLISRKKQLPMNNSIHRFPPEVKKAIRTLSKLKRKIKEYEKQD